MPYARHTTVSQEKSLAEIEALLKRYGADQFARGWSTGKATIGFRAHSRYVRFELVFPDKDDERFRSKRRPYTRSRWDPTTNARVTTRVGTGTDAYDAEVRRLWRALALVVKAKLEAVESGIATFESEFMAHIVMPDGRTVGEHVRPAIEQAYKSGKMPPLLPAFTGGA